MATAQLSAMLDELMGKTRNLDPDVAKKVETRWDDPTVCKFYLVGFCPHDMFVNTKMDIGACDKIHDDGFKKAYRESRYFEKLSYEKELYRFCERLVNECDRKVEKNNDRVQQSKTAGSLNGAGTDPVTLKREKLQKLSEQIDALVVDAEKLGNEGEVDKAQDLLKQIDQLRAERDMTANNLSIAIAYDKELEVCTQCGAMLIKNDVEQRVQDHLNGKLHIGMGRLREYAAEYKARFLNRTKSPAAARLGDRRRSDGARDAPRPRPDDARRRSRSRSRGRRSDARDADPRRRDEPRDNDLRRRDDARRRDDDARRRDDPRRGVDARRRSPSPPADKHKRRRSGSRPEEQREAASSRDRERDRERNRAREHDRPSSPRRRSRSPPPRR